MKKIPTLFERVYKNHRVVSITRNIGMGMEWVLDGKGVATVKMDGACCAIIDGKLYRRYDAKRGRKPPEGAIPCCAPDPVTGHWPHWVACREGNTADKWFLEAYKNTSQIDTLTDGTYEAIGPHFQGNPYGLNKDTLDKHGRWGIRVERSFEGIRDFLRENHHMEGIVFWRDGEPRCKIKRTDFGFPWPDREE